MLRKLCCISILTLFVLLDLRAGDDLRGGGRAAALSFAASTLQDVWSVNFNQAGLAYIRNPSFGVFAENRFNISELTTSGIVAALPLGRGTFGLSVNTFGYSQYREGKYGLAYGMKLSDKFGLGVQLDYFNTTIGEGYGSASAVTFELGMQYQLNQDVRLSAHLFNPGRADLTEFNDENIPTVLRAGAQYTFSEKVFVVGEVVKDIDQDASVRAGFEYQVIDKVALRMGVGSKPANTSFGLGLKFDALQIDIAASYLTDLGYSPQISASYEIR